MIYLVIEFFQVLFNILDVDQDLFDVVQRAATIENRPVIWMTDIHRISGWKRLRLDSFPLAS